MDSGSSMEKCPLESWAFSAGLALIVSVIRIEARLSHAFLLLFFSLLDISKCDDEQNRQFKNGPIIWRNFSQKLNLFRVRVLTFSAAESGL